MLLGFKSRFAPHIEDGSKTHTIRGRRKRRPHVGETAHCYVNPRRKTMRLLGRWPLTRVEEIVIAEDPSHEERLLVTIEGKRIESDEAEQLFYRDGFRDQTGETYQSMAQARMFWDGALPFTGDLIHWDFSQRMQKSKRGKRG